MIESGLQGRFFRSGHMSADLTGNEHGILSIWQSRAAHYRL